MRSNFFIKEIFLFQTIEREFSSKSEENFHLFSLCCCQYEMQKFQNETHVWERFEFYLQNCCQLRAIQMEKNRSCWFFPFLSFQFISWWVERKTRFKEYKKRMSSFNCRIHTYNLWCSCLGCCLVWKPRVIERKQVKTFLPENILIVHLKWNEEMWQIKRKKKMVRKRNFWITLVGCDVCTW